MKINFHTSLFVFVGLMFFSCKNEVAKPLSAIELKGKEVYMANCSVCHGPNPVLVGSVGPEIAWSSKELLTTRILHHPYPPGYKPKRQSSLMPALPFLEANISALHAYLNSFQKPPRI